MRDERGFTLTEMMAALLVLSIGLVSLGEITGIIIRSWSHMQKANVRVAELTSIATKMLEAETVLKADADNESDTGLLTDDGDILMVAAPKLDRPKSCEYDLVGRRCRQ